MKLYCAWFNVFCCLLVYQNVAFSFEDRYFKISEFKEFYLSEMENSEEVNALKNEPFIAISLGCNCWPAVHLQEHTLRKRSFPLDWMITSFDSIYKILEADFYGFLDMRHMRMWKVNIYGAEFAHDFTRANWKEESQGFVPINEAGRMEYEEILFRYAKRIARFYRVFSLGIPIYLFRWDITREQAHKLYDLLMHKFQDSDIHLVCLQNNGLNGDQDWGHPKIHHFSIAPEDRVEWDRILRPAEDRSRNPAWTRILTSLGLLVYHWNTSD